LDKTLTKFLHVTKDDKFSIMSSYQDILEELDND